MQTGIIKVGVSGILVRDRKILMGLRFPGDASLPNHWCTPGGGVNFHELLEDALVREFKEETLLDILVSKVVTVTERMSAVDKHSIMVFYRVYGVDNKIGPRIGEDFTDIHWFTRQEIESTESITSQTREALRVFYDKS